MDGIKTNDNKTAKDFVSENSNIYNYLKFHGLIATGVANDFYDDGHNPLSPLDIEEANPDRLMRESAYNFNVSVNDLKLEDEDLSLKLNGPGYEDDLSEEFLWDRCLPDQMFVFSEGDIPRILDVTISQMIPTRSKHQKPIPANMLFLCSRYAHYFGTPEILENLLPPAFQRIRSVIMEKTQDVAFMSYWLSNATLLLYYLRKDPGLLTATIRYQETLSELITDCVVLISQDVERRLDAVLDASILDYQTIPGLDEIEYQSDWRIFKKKHRHKKTQEEETVENTRPPSPKTKMKPSPRNVTSILGSILFICGPELYDIHPIIIQELMSQIFYWMGCVLFNRIMSNRKYLSRSKAMQIRLNVSAIEDWVRANNRQPEPIQDEFHEGKGKEYPSLVDLLNNHFKPLIQMLQWLQIFTGLTGPVPGHSEVSSDFNVAVNKPNDFTNVVTTLQQLNCLNPKQLLHVANKYRLEVGEPGLSKEYKKYLAQLGLHYQTNRSHNHKVINSTIHSVLDQAGSHGDDLKKEAEDEVKKALEKGRKKSIDAEVPKVISNNNNNNNNNQKDSSDKDNINNKKEEENDNKSKKEKEESPATESETEQAYKIADTPIPIKPSNSVVASNGATVFSEDEDEDEYTRGSSGEIYLDASVVLPFVIPTITEMIVTWGRGIGGIHRQRAKQYEPSLPLEFLDKLDINNNNSNASGNGNPAFTNYNPIFGELAVPEPSAHKTWGGFEDSNDFDDLRPVW